MILVLIDIPTINKMNRIELNKLSKIIIDSSITVHKEMGPGLLETVYEHCLIKELST